MTVRAKFRVMERANRAGWSPDAKPTCFVRLAPVTASSEENKSWAKYTPSGSIEMNIDNPEAYDAFELGAEYYVDFTKAEGAK